MFFKFNIYSIFNCNMLYFAHIYLQTEKGMNRRFCPFLNTTAHIKSTNGAHNITKKESCPPAEQQSQLHPSEHPSVSMQQ